MRQVLGDQRVTDVLAIYRQISAGPPVVAGLRSLGARPARAYDDLQVDVLAQLDHLPQAGCSARSEHSLEAAVGVLSELRRVEADKANAFAERLDRVAV